MTLRQFPACSAATECVRVAARAAQPVRATPSFHSVLAVSIAKFWGPAPPRGPVSSFPAAAACHSRWRLILSAPPSSSVVPLLPSYCAPLASHAPRLQGSFLTAVPPSSVSVAGDGWLSWRVRPVYIRWSYRSGPGEARHFAARVASPPCFSLGRTVSPAFAVVALVCSVLRSDSRRAL